MTFIVSHNGDVYEQDLGPDTAQAAAAINVFNPDKSWDEGGHDAGSPIIENERRVSLQQRTEEAKRILDQSLPEGTRRPIGWIEPDRLRNVGLLQSTQCRRRTRH